MPLKPPSGDGRAGDAQSGAPLEGPQAGAPLEGSQAVVPVEGSQARVPVEGSQVGGPQAMRALAHPTRLAILTHLQRHGPATATALSPHVGATPSVTSWHLRHLAGYGLVIDAEPAEVPGDRRQRWWKAIARDATLQPDTAARTAAHLLARHLMAVAQQQVDHWLTETGPRLEPEWKHVAGLSTTSAAMTATELEALTHQIEDLIAPFVHRAGSDAPAGTRTVRILRHYLPEAPQ